MHQGRARARGGWAGARVGQPRLHHRRCNTCPVQQARVVILLLLRRQRPVRPRAAAQGQRHHLPQRADALVRAPAARVGQALHGRALGDEPHPPQGGKQLALNCVFRRVLEQHGAHAGDAGETRGMQDTHKCQEDCVKGTHTTTDERVEWLFVTHGLKMHRGSHAPLLLPVAPAAHIAPGGRSRGSLLPGTSPPAPRSGCGTWQSRIHGPSSRLQRAALRG